MRLRAHTPGGSKPCRIASTASTSASGAPSFSATGARSPVQVAGLVDQVDEILPDHAARGIGDRQRELLGEMIGERRLGRDEGFEIVVAVLAAGGAGAGPFGIARRHLGGGARGDRVGLVEAMVERASRASSAAARGSPESSPASRRRRSRPPRAIALVPGLGRATPPRRRPRRRRCARAADCARARSPRRWRDRDWRAAAA